MKHRSLISLANTFSAIVKQAKIRNVNENDAMGSRFDITKFREMSESTNLGTKSKLIQLNEYAKNFLQVLGEGSSRRAYLLSSKKVLKVAMNEFGLSQNLTEAENAEYTDMPLVPQIFDKSEYNPPGLLWIIVELVRPITEAEFGTATGTPWEMFEYELEEYYSKARRGNDDDEDEEEFEADEFTKGVAQFVVENNLLIGDVLNLDHWGITADRKPVLLDSGFSRESMMHRR
jgi:hypothetical protein